jgi:hypothetical protein
MKDGKGNQVNIPELRMRRSGSSDLDKLQSEISRRSILGVAEEFAFLSNSIGLTERPRTNRQSVFRL